MQSTQTKNKMQNKKY